MFQQETQSFGVENLAHAYYLKNINIKESSEKMVCLNPSDLMRLVEHVGDVFEKIKEMESVCSNRETGSNYYNFAEDYEGVLWFQLFGEYDLDNAQNLWSVLAVGRRDEPKTIFIDSDGSGSLVALPVKASCDLIQFKKMELEKKVVDFRSLEDGWDSYEAPMIDERAIDRSLVLIDSVFSRFRNRDLNSISFFAAPLCNGGIQVEMDSLNAAIQIEVEPGESGRIYYYAQWMGKQALRGYRGGPFVSVDYLEKFLPA